MTIFVIFKIIVQYLIQIVQKSTNKIHSTEFLEKHRKKPAYFTRNRTLTFPSLISFMLNALNGSIQAELV